MLFDDERPPESRLVGEYEEITWNDDLLKDNNHHSTAADHHQYEVVNLPVADLQPVQDEHQVRNCLYAHRLDLSTLPLCRHILSTSC